MDQAALGDGVGGPEFDAGELRAVEAVVDEKDVVTLGGEAGGVLAVDYSEGLCVEVRELEVGEGSEVEVECADSMGCHLVHGFDGRCRVLRAGLGGGAGRL